MELFFATNNLIFWQVWGKSHSATIICYFLKTFWNVKGVKGQTIFFNIFIFNNFKLVFIITYLVIFVWGKLYITIGTITSHRWCGHWWTFCRSSHSSMHSNVSRQTGFFVRGITAVLASKRSSWFCRWDHVVQRNSSPSFSQRTRWMGVFLRYGSKVFRWGTSAVIFRYSRTMNSQFFYKRKIYFVMKTLLLSHRAIK